MNPQDAPSFDPYKALEEANEKLRRSESRFHTLFGLGNEGIVIIAADGKPSFISPSIKKVMGYTDAELMELSLGALVHPDELQTIKDIQLLAMNNPGKVLSIPLRAAVTKTEVTAG